MSGETMIPILPCASLDPVLDFYADLGFEITYRQKAPSVYGAVRRGAIELHFYVIRGHRSETNHATCAAIVDDPASLHAAFAAALRERHGRVPAVGFPRLARWRKGQTRFNVVDPAGNYIRFISRSEHEANAPTPTGAGASSRLAGAVLVAGTLRDSSGDDHHAARVLDVALARPEPAPVRDRARAIVARAELASVLGEGGTFARLRAEFDALPLDDADRAELRDEIAELEGLDAPAATPSAG